MLKINNNHKVFIDRGKFNTGINIEDWVEELNKYEIGELYISSIDQDGTRKDLIINFIKNYQINFDTNYCF